MRKARARVVTEEWATPADRREYDNWPRGETQFLMYFDRVIMQGLAQGIVAPELQDRAKRLLEPIVPARAVQPGKG